MVYRGFGDFSIILYIHTCGYGGGLAWAMNKSSIIPQIKKSYPQNKPSNTLGVFLVLTWGGFKENDF